MNVTFPRLTDLSCVGRRRKPCNQLLHRPSVHHTRFPIETFSAGCLAETPHPFVMRTHLETCPTSLDRNSSFCDVDVFSILSLLCIRMHRRPHGFGFPFSHSFSVLFLVVTPNCQYVMMLSPTPSFVLRVSLVLPRLRAAVLVVVFSTRIQI